MKKIYFFLLALTVSFYAKTQNNAPVAVNDTVTIYHKGESHSINVISNDYDADGDSIYITWINGVLMNSFNNENIITTPRSAYYSGISLIRYKINDIFGNSSDTAFLIIKFFSLLGDSLTISNINARINPNNNHFWDQINLSHFEVPKGQATTTMFVSDLWIGGKRSSDNALCLEANRFHGQGADLFQGPLKIDGTASTDSTTMAKWNCSWKVRTSEINEFRAWHANPSSNSAYLIPNSILFWPANGNANDGFASTIAPFVDVDSDGIYIPHNGDFPKIKGDEAIFYIVNDNGGVHTETGGLPLGVEIQGMAYAFDCPDDSALFNSIFIDYTIINRSIYTYDSTYIGSFNDIDLGFAEDDYLGCDVYRSTIFGYNGKSIDGSGKPSHFGANPPIQSVTILNGPFKDANGEDDLINIPSIVSNGRGYSDGVIDNEQFGMEGFTYFNNTGGFYAMTDPDNSVEYYNILQSKWKDSTSIMYGKNGHQNSGANEPCKYMFPGLSDIYNWGTGGMAPIVDKNWTEEISDNEPFDRRGTMVCGPFTFKPGDVQHLELAYTFSRNYSDTSRLAALPIMQARVDSLRSYFKAERTPCGSIFSSIEKKKNTESGLRVYPNPAKDYCIIEYTSNINEVISINVFDINGRVVISKKTNTIIGKNTFSINTNELNSGVYIIKVETSLDNKVVRLVIN